MKPIGNFNNEDRETPTAAPSDASLSTDALKNNHDRAEAPKPDGNAGSTDSNASRPCIDSESANAAAQDDIHLSGNSQDASSSLPGTEDDTSEFIHPADAAEQLEQLPLEEQVEIIRSMPAEDAAETLAEMDEHVRVEVLESLAEDEAADIVGQMSPDDAADILDELDEDHSDALLSKLGKEDAEEIRSLMAFDPDTAGGVMNTEIQALSKDLTADQAIVQIRSEIEYKEVPYYIYVVDKSEHLIGVLTLRDLMKSPPRVTLEEQVRGQEIISVTFDQGREEVARLIARYNLMALPVLHHNGTLLGIVSHDDVIDIMHDLASEDMLGMVGAGQDETVDTPWSESILMRLPWLLVNMFNSALSAAVVYIFDGTIAQMAILAVFMPMVANQAGNTGQQALAVIIRQMALEKFERKKALAAVIREAKIGLLNGLILGAIVWVVVYLFLDWTAADPRFNSAALSTIMVSALVLDMIIGALAGASIPLVLKKLGRDPAQASSIFLTAITDALGFLLFLGLATMFLF